MILFIREMSKMATSFDNLVNLASLVNIKFGPRTTLKGKVATKSSSICPLLAYLAMIFLWSLILTNVSLS